MTPTKTEQNKKPTPPKQYFVKNPPVTIDCRVLFLHLTLHQTNLRNSDLGVYPIQKGER